MIVALYIPWRPPLIGAQLPLTTAGMGTAMISHGEWHNRRKHNCIASDLATAATHCYCWHKSPPPAAAARRCCRLPPPAAATTASISCHRRHHRHHSVGKSDGAGAGADADGDAEESSSIVNRGVSKFHVSYVVCTGKKLIKLIELFDFFLGRKNSLRL